MKRSAVKLFWRVGGIEGQGYEVSLFDPFDPYSVPFCILPQDARPWALPQDLTPVSWATKEEAREAAVAALRDLADRIERGDK